MAKKNNGGAGCGCLVLVALVIGGISHACSGPAPHSTLPAYRPPVTTTAAPWSPAQLAPAFPTTEPAAPTTTEVAVSDDAPYVPAPDPYVPAPDHAPDVVPGDTAVCNDGTVTHPLHHRGACSHHHGVARWV
ncbi:DUF3761 domain-containing protein [Pseudonocardia sp. T1-2H]|uniref:DUF3761 domain-containing protein n=1 Tax=Pseudonocardia sp. T1-2H TaxID=3128899 RepID=UPI003101646F